jgi:hypothetical protein
LDSGDPASGQVVATAAVRVRLRDWLGAWLQVFVETAAGSNPLPDEFTQVAEIGKSGAAVVNGVYGRVREFTAGQRGLVGDYAGRRVVAAGIRQFVESGAANLPPEVRVSVSPAVGVASDAIATAGTALVDAVASTRADFTKFQQTATDQIAAKADVAALNAKADVAAVDALNSAVKTKADASEVAAVRDSLAAKADASAFQTFQSQVTANLDRKVDAAAFDSFRTDITKQIGNRLTRADLEAIQAQLNTITATQTNFATQLGNKVDVTTFSGFQTQTNNALRNKVNVTTFNNLSTSVQSMINRLGPIG